MKQLCLLRIAAHLTRTLCVAGVAIVLLCSVAFVSTKETTPGALAYTAETTPINTSTDTKDVKAPATTSQLDDYTDPGGCGSLKPCGVVHNLSHKSVHLRKHSGDMWQCTNPSPFSPLGSATKSTTIWQDTDCFGSTNHRVFYLPAGGWVDAGEYVRIHNHVWVLPWPL